MADEMEIEIGSKDVGNLADILGLYEAAEEDTEVKGPDPAVWGEAQAVPAEEPVPDPWLSPDKYVGLLVEETPDDVAEEDLDQYTVKGPM